jgi:hypothetical protein
LFARLTASEISSNVTHWPEHLVVEVRECTTCARRISRLIGDARRVAEVLEATAA